MAVPSRSDTGERSKRTPSRKAPLPIDGRVRNASRLTLALLLVALSLWVAWDFLAPIGWAVVIAITTWPLYLRFSSMIAGGRAASLAPLLFTLITGVVLFVPILLTVHQVAQDGAAIAASLNHYRTNGVPVPDWMQHVPVLGRHAARWWSVNLADAKAAAEWLGSADTKNDAAMTRALGSQVLHRTFLFVVAMIALFVLLRNGAWMANRMLETADRLLGDPGERLASKMVDAVRGTVGGTVAVAVVEGAIIGAAYVVAGVPNAMLLMVLTMAFAMLPLGAWAIFTLASVLLVLQGGSALAAAGVFGFGAIVMLIGDTFVWPKIVGDAARMPFLAALIGIFGGAQAFGLIGLFLGPVILAALLSVWRDWLVPQN